MDKKIEVNGFTIGTVDDEHGYVLVSPPPVAPPAVMLDAEWFDRAITAVIDNLPDGCTVDKIMKRKAGPERSSVIVTQTFGDDAPDGVVSITRRIGKQQLAAALVRCGDRYVGYPDGALDHIDELVDHLGLRAGASVEACA